MKPAEIRFCLRFFEQPVSFVSPEESLLFAHQILMMLKTNVRTLLLNCLVIILAGVVSSCASDPAKTNQSEKATVMPTDPHSAARPQEAVVAHEHFQLQVDFDKKVISGIATLTVRNPSKGKKLLLDTRNLAIDAVFLEKEGAKTDFNLGADQPFIGQALEVKITEAEKQTVIVHYRTTEGADALQWLSPEQTAGKTHPFMFTQGQAILSRTWFPCQDSPGIRFTWSADVTVPKDLEAIMSAEKRTADSAAGKYHFEMTKPVPAYLVALSAGNLAFKAIDDRTGVFAEPEMLDRSVYEFADMGKMVAAAEKLYGAYRWGRYDVLVLPPSFPFGGMENPCVTFATPNWRTPGPAIWLQMPPGMISGSTKDSPCISNAALWNRWKEKSMPTCWR
jgi:leukotriene-A4 hydrolase